MQPNSTIRGATFVDYLQLLVLSAIWGSSFIAIEIALVGLPPLLVAFGRISLAFLFLLFVVFYQNIPFPKDKKTWLILAFAGILNNAIPFFLISWGQQYIDSATAAIMLSSSPFIALVLSHFTTHDEKFSFVKLLSVILGFLGVFVLVGDDVLDQRVDAIYGQIAVFLATMGYISSGILIRKISHVHTIMCSTSMLLFATLFLFPFISLPNDLHVSQKSAVAVVFLAIIPTAFASLVRVKLVKSVGIQFMSQVAYIIPMFAIFWAWVFFREIPNSNTLLALGLIVLGLFIRRVKHR
jgi:drug/metabolite transporter (DMT)-like permease